MLPWKVCAKDGVMDAMREHINNVGVLRQALEVLRKIFNKSSVCVDGAPPNCVTVKMVSQTRTNY